MSTRELISELKISYKEYFESCLAITFIQHSELLPAVRKVSLAIAELIKKNFQLLLQEIIRNPKIKEDLFDEKNFGRFKKEEKYSENPEDILDIFLKNIINEQTPLHQVMQMHSVFIYRLYPKINVNMEKSTATNKIFSSELFSNRCRIEKKTKPVKTKQLGISDNPVFCKLIGKGEDHIRARDRFTADMKSTAWDKVVNNYIPYVADVSGHTSSFILGTKSYGDLNQSELQEYALACFAFLTAGGNHSFHEVMIVAKQYGVIYEINDYSKSIPDTILRHSSFKKITSRFPEFLIQNQDVKENTKSNIIPNLFLKIDFIKSLHHELTEKLGGDQFSAGLVMQYVNDSIGLHR